jgi:hypothetical protein
LWSYETEGFTKLDFSFVVMMEITASAALIPCSRVNSANILVVDSRNFVLVFRGGAFSYDYTKKALKPLIGHEPKKR